MPEPEKSNQLLPLNCKAQNYAWGKIGQSSVVAKLSGLAGNAVDPNQPYAEVWHLKLFDFVLAMIQDLIWK
jgi:mannose-6-phosphate isomerase class I